jgi:WD40-like Beta Propeller Repeat
MRTNRTANPRVPGNVVGVLSPFRIFLERVCFAAMVVVLCALNVGFAAPALAAGDANTAACPNEESSGFRPYLPDCRAYELVTPPFKEGFPVATAGYFAANFGAGPGEDAPLFEGNSFGAFAGGPDANSFGEGNDYFFRRTASGWVTVAADPQPSEFVGNDAFSRLGGAVLSADAHGTALMDLHRPSESAWTQDLYLRGIDGALTEVGPMVPPSAVPPGPTGVLSAKSGIVQFVGASQDLSHVLFQVTDSRVVPPGVTTNLWPGDTTLANTGEGSLGPSLSLYEHAGTGQSEPRLVGVRNEGPLDGHPSINEGAELISKCGTSLGAPHNGNRHHAISASGDVVYFTPNHACLEGGPGSGPPVFELYARDNGSSTVDVSEPSPSECASDAECEGAAPADANFEGASADGGLAYFTSTQKLLPTASEDTTTTDSAAVEGCQLTTGEHGCNLYVFVQGAGGSHHLNLVSGGDTSGLGPEVQGVAAMSEDGTSVYFVAKGVLASNAGAGDEPGTSEPQHAAAGAENLYLYRRSAGGSGGAITFVATLGEFDSFQWPRDASGAMNVTPDGRFLVFNSFSDLTPDDTSTAAQVFIYDAMEATLKRVSIGDQGFNNDGNTEISDAIIRQPSTQAVYNYDTNPSVSNDGSVVAFSSTAALTPNALSDPANRARNAYEYRDGRVFLLSDGKSALGSSELFFGANSVGVSSNGTDIFVATGGRLVPEDTDSLIDIYDVRVGGGAPRTLGASQCRDDGCQQPGPEAAFSSPPASTSFPGEAAVPKSTVLPPTPAPKPSRAQQLQKALKACSKRPRAKRARCRAAARKRYGPHRHAHRGTPRK